jgi:hypothetical protein
MSWMKGLRSRVGASVQEGLTEKVRVAKLQERRTRLEDNVAGADNALYDLLFGQGGAGLMGEGGELSFESLMKPTFDPEMGRQIEEAGAMELDSITKALEASAARQKNQETANAASMGIAGSSWNAASRGLVDQQMMQSLAQEAGRIGSGVRQQKLETALGQQQFKAGLLGNMLLPSMMSMRASPELNRLTDIEIARIQAKAQKDAAKASKPGWGAALGGIVGMGFGGLMGNPGLF